MTERTSSCETVRAECDSCRGHRPSTGRGYPMIADGQDPSGPLPPQCQGAEARTILTSAPTLGGLARAWLAATSDLRGEAIPSPQRSAPRPIDVT